MKESKNPASLAEEKFRLDSSSIISRKVLEVILSQDVEGVLALKILLGLNKKNKREFLLQQGFEYLNKDYFISESYPSAKSKLFKKDHPLSFLRKNRKISFPRFIKDELFPRPDSFTENDIGIELFLSCHITQETILVKDFIPIVNSFLKDRKARNFSFFLPMFIGESLRIFSKIKKFENSIDYLPILSIPQNGPNSSRIILTLENTDNSGFQVGYHEEGWAIPPLSVFWTLTDKPLSKI